MKFDVKGRQHGTGGVKKGVVRGSLRYGNRQRLKGKSAAHRRRRVSRVSPVEGVKARGERNPWGKEWFPLTWTTWKEKTEGRGRDSQKAL